MKTIKNSFYKELTFNNLLDAYLRAKKGKGDRLEILLFSFDLEVNIINLMNSITSFKYKTSNYSSFVIYEPKKRVIRSLPFIDRVVQQWYVESFIKPYFVPRFIYDSYACINNKGTHKAIKRLQVFMNKMGNNYY